MIKAFVKSSQNLRKICMAEIIIPLATAVFYESDGPSKSRTGNIREVLMKSARKQRKLWMRDRQRRCVTRSSFIQLSWECVKDIDRNYVDSSAF